MKLRYTLLIVTGFVLTPVLIKTSPIIFPSAVRISLPKIKIPSIKSFKTTAPWTTVYQKLTPSITKATNDEQVNPALVVAIIHTESDGKFKVKRGGPIGPMQIEPVTGRAMRSNIWNVPGNILAGTRLIKSLLIKYDGDLVKSLEAYNCGTGCVDRNKIPSSSRRYSKTIINYMNGLTGG